MASTSTSAPFLADVLSCPVCLELYNDPRLLSCGHSLCGQCCSNMVKRAQQLSGIIPGDSQPEITCPQCRRTTLCIQDMPANWSLANVVEKYGCLRGDTEYRHCHVCSKRRSQNGILAAIGKMFSQFMRGVSKSHRQRQDAFEKLHEIHEGLDQEISDTQSGNVKLIDTLNAIIQAMRSSARDRFETVALKIENNDKPPHHDFYQFVLADAEIIRANNEQLCGQVTVMQQNIHNVLVETLQQIDNDMRSQRESPSRKMTGLSDELKRAEAMSTGTGMSRDTSGISTASSRSQ